MLIKRNEPLRLHTTFKLGGKVTLFIEPADARELQQALTMLRARGLAVRVIGSGSNILCAGRLRPQAVIRLSAAGFGWLRAKSGRIAVGAGCPLARLLEFCARRGLSNLEPLTGIPGTVGGALAMNAGITQPGNKRIAIGDFVESVTVMDYNSNIKILTPAHLRFSYRSSNLQDLIVLEAVLRVRASSVQRVRLRMKQYRLARAGQEYRYPSAGCVFKNPAGASAGKIIDECGFKGRRLGRAFVSEKHANFICCYPGAKASEVLALMRLIQRGVKQKKGIRLEPEIRIWK